METESFGSVKLFQRLGHFTEKALLWTQMADGSIGLGRVPTAPGKPGKMVTVFPAWKNPGILSFLPNILEK